MRYENLAAPFGREYPGSVNATLLVNMGPGFLVAEVAGPIAAFNVVVLSALALAGASMYLLVRWLGAGRGPAVVAGLALSLAPYLLNRAASGHPVLMHIECFPLLLMAGIWWTERPTIRRAALLGAAWLLCWLSNPYFGVAGGLIVGCFAVWSAVAALRRDAAREALARVGQIAAAVLLVVVVPIYGLYLTSRGEVELLFTRQKFELLLYGARLDDYVRPPGDSMGWGWVGNPFAFVAGAERLAYPGGVTIALALVGIGAAIWASRSGMTPRMRTAALIPLLIVPVVVLCSLASPQTLLGVDLHLPSELIFEFMPFIRAFARLSSAVVAVLVAAAAVGLWFLIRRRPPAVRAGVVLAAAALVVLEAQELPISSAEPVVIEGGSPRDVPTWRWLADRHTDEIIFEMPGEPNEPLERYFMIGQTLHRHPMTNGSLVLGSLGQDFQKLVGDPSQPSRPEWLASAGIDLLVVEPWAYRVAKRPLALDPAEPPPGFAMEESFGSHGAIWRVIAPPAAGIPIFRTQGWWPPENLPDGRVWRWMDDEGHITVVARAAGLHRIGFHVAGWGPASRTLEISGPDGFVQRVATGPEERLVEMEMPLRKGRNDVVVANIGPRAERISEADPRIVSVRMSEWVLRRVR